MAEQKQQKQTESMNNAVSEFTVQLYRKLSNKNASDENLFLSPYSISSALMLTMLGCAGNSEAQLRSGLCLDTIPKEKGVHEEYRKLRESLNGMTGESCELAIANRVFAKMGLPVLEAYKARSKEFYGSQLELLDFVGDSEGSRKRINDWVEQQTNNKIKDLIPSGTLDARSVIVLTNAIYFKGTWEKIFQKESTVKRPFHLSDAESKEVDMMFMEEESFLCGSSGTFDCKMLRMPYKGRQLSLLVLLPNKVNGLQELEKNLSLSMLSQLKKDMEYQEANITLPKFKIESSFELAKLLPEMGILDIFSARAADFSRMFTSQQDNVAVSNVIHKAFVEVNEEGTEAAAATAIMARVMCGRFGPIFDFVADHPFLFLIMENTNDTILFIGRHAKPQE